jgi:predicted CXXCH cytochrome family protein
MVPHPRPLTLGKTPTVGDTAQPRAEGLLNFARLRRSIRGMAVAHGEVTRDAARSGAASKSKGKGLLVMKKAIVAVALLGLASAAQASIAGGPHDLSNSGGGWGGGKGGTISSCQYCHAPHNVNTNITVPLWNRNSDATTNATFAASFTKYASQTLSVKTGFTPGGGSLTCLSCHDGVSDMGLTYVGSKGFASATSMGTSSFAAVGGASGKDLTNDHPVGVPFVAGANGMKATVVTALTDHLYGASKTVECGTCHDPHGAWDGITGGASFLRVSATTICSECHNK